MTKSHFDLIRKSKWMDSDSTEFMSINMQTPLHVVYERVTLNVAASFGVDYRDMMKSNDRNPMYVGYCIVIILLDRIFRNIFNMDSDERLTMIRQQHFKVVEDFRKHKSF